jgi:hypothetical protein
VLGAAIAGVLPGLKVTRGLQARLRQAAAGAGGLTFGGVWTAVIVAQIAVTLAFPVVAFNVARDAADTRAMVADFPAAEFLSARIALDREPPPGADTSFAAFVVRRQATVRELERRLRAEPGVVGVTLAERLPRMEHPPQKIEVDSGGAAPENPDSRAATGRAPRPSTRTTSTCWALRCAPDARSTPATSRPTPASSS